MDEESIHSRLMRVDIDVTLLPENIYSLAF
jgi:hypothetical protein